MLLSKSLSIRNCEKVFRIYVQSKVLYASESKTPTKDDLLRLARNKRAMVR